MAAAGIDLSKVLDSDTCQGCGIKLQNKDPSAPGYFQVPKRIMDSLLNDAMGGESQEGAGEDAAPALEGGWGEAAQLEPSELAASHSDGEDAGGADDSDEDDDSHVMVVDMAGEPGWGADGMLAGDSGAGEPVAEEDADALFDAFDDMVEGWLDDDDAEPEEEYRRGDKYRKGGYVPMGPEDMPSDPNAILCARCYSLIHYGRVKSQEAEEALPGFSLRRAVAKRIRNAVMKDRTAVLACVVDVADFDGSLPRAALMDVLPRDPDGNPTTMSRTRFVLIANKTDLLPRQATRTRIEAWARRRARQGGLPRPDEVFLVSAATGRGVPTLMEGLEEQAGARGEIFVVGAQNAGKSSLINAMRRQRGLRARITAAPLPGTTLGLIEVRGLLEGGVRLWDTPGVRHGYQLSARMDAEELRDAMAAKTLQPRTYRLGEGRSVTIAGLARVDVIESPHATLYLTVWASQNLVLHMGKTERAPALLRDHVGDLLSPPRSAERGASLGELVPADVEVEGSSWRESSVDVCVSGLGWVAVGCEGPALLRVWAPRGVAVTTRDALVPDFAKRFETPGFSSNMPLVAGGKKGRKEATQSKQARRTGTRLDRGGKRTTRTKKTGGRGRR
ncbi:unnamed protein product [Pedinophyceae sp. YPF-701]|nr:unnamed protein product [Pedinophyceae sp. YPF-701]